MAQEPHGTIVGAALVEEQSGQRATRVGTQEGDRTMRGMMGGGAQALEGELGPLIQELKQLKTKSNHAGAARAGWNGVQSAAYPATHKWQDGMLRAL